MIPLPEQLEDDVERLSAGVYKAATQRYVELMRHCSYVKSVGTFGSVGSPGISDLDMLVLCERSRYSETLRDTQLAISVVQEGSYLFMHPPVVIPTDLLQVASILRTFDNLTTLHGMPVVLSFVPSSARLIRAIVWNTFVWSGIAKSLRYSSSRRLLLLMGTIAQGISANIMLAEHRWDPRPLAFSREMRRRFLQSSAGRRNHVLRSAWISLLKWFAHTTWSVHECYADTRAVTARRRTKLRIGDVTLSFFDQRVEKRSSDDRTNELVLPTICVDVAVALEHWFNSPYMTCRADGDYWDPIVTPEVLLGVEGYGRAVEQTLELATAERFPRYEFFKHAFVFPFALRPTVQAYESHA